MKKTRILAILGGCFAVIGTPALAAYPAYPARQVTTQNVQMPQAYPTYQATNAQGQMIYLPTTSNTVITANTATAASPTRVTGALPRVGSTATAAGRQYYQPADYDRLADSGLYVGLSVGYSASVMGSMHADYENEDKAFTVPGAFQDADFNSDSVIPLQISVGASINNDVRVDFSYLRYSGLDYASTVQTADGAGGFIEATVDGGAVKSNVTMLNIYYNIDSFTGYLAGGMLRPYIGAGAGLALNTISDYVVYDNTFYSEMDPAGAGAGDLTGISDIYSYHNGGTKEQFAFMLEGGLTTELDGGIKMDFFVRYANLGKVSTSGSIIVSQTEWLGDGAGQEYQAPYDSVFHYTNYRESGRLSMVDVGVRLRLQF